jgi:rod shape-determining protein MreC
MINAFGWTVRGPSALTRLLLLGALSAALMVLDHRGNHLEKIRGALSVAAYPIQVLASVPPRVVSNVSEWFTSETTLREHLDQTRAERDLLLAKVQQFESLETENNRLRQLLGSAQRVADRALAAELIEVSSEPFTRHIVVARGANHGAYLGQPVIDAHGIVGQVIQTGPISSRVMLLTDAGHAIPALVNRNGLRALVYGTGAHDTLKIPYLTGSADIRKGDLLVSSGLGGIFPPGYPVAQVVDIVNDPNEGFLEIKAKPAAQINHSKQVLLIWPGQLLPAPAPKEPSKKETKRGVKP